MFEVSGAAAAALAATDLVRVRGTIVIVGIHPGPRPFDLHRIFMRELRVVGARVHQRVDFERAVELLALGAIPAEGLITHIAPLSATAEAFAALESGQADEGPHRPGPPSLSPSGTYQARAYDSSGRLYARSTAVSMASSRPSRCSSTSRAR